MPLINAYPMFASQVALKTLIVVHRLLREGDPTFKEEFLAYSSRGNILHIANFKDDSSQSGESLYTLLGISVMFHSLSMMINSSILNLSAWDCSAWVRTYAFFLEERLECFRVLKYDIETERLVRYPPTSSKVIFYLLKFLHSIFFFWNKPGSRAADYINKEEILHSILMI